MRKNLYLGWIWADGQSQRPNESFAPRLPGNKWIIEYTRINLRPLPQPHQEKSENCFFLKEINPSGWRKMKEEKQHRIWGAGKQMEK